MKQYFKNNYNKVNYPIGDDDNPGLRNAQLGAIHSISSFFTLNETKPALIVMPTGSGKTAVLTMVPFVLKSDKVLVVTPAKMVRQQIKEEFSLLKTLHKARVFKDKIDKPEVYEMKHKIENEDLESIEKAEVVVATPICALSLSKYSKYKNLFDLTLIDEAHHVPAKTWTEILLNMKHTKKVLFTATPFRMDEKEIKGEIIYNYPLSQAYKDEIFGEIKYIPVKKSEEKDKLISKKAEEIYLLDQEEGYKHYLMVRAKSKAKSKKLEKLYKENTELKLKRVDSSMAKSTAQKAIDQLKDGELDGIICVNMLGEGFDFPNLKIAAVHGPHKSLASTLQFIGRFARTNASNIGTAKFIAMNDEELKIENKSLYKSDAVWQEIIIDLSEQRVEEEETQKNYVSSYIDKNPENIDENQFSLYGIKTNLHAKIFQVEDFDIEANFPDICAIKFGPFINENENTVVAVGRNYFTPKWYSGNRLKDIENILFIIHYQESTKLVFIYSQIKSESLYEKIIESFSSDYKNISRYEMNRVLANLNNREMFNTGMQHRYEESGESYRIIAGSDTSQNIDPNTGKIFSAGHVFCKADFGEEEITIGYSSGSKIWSSSYGNLREFVRWCNKNGNKIEDSTLEVKTNTNFDYLPVPKKLNEYPDNIFLASFPGEVYAKPYPIYSKEDDKKIGLIVDLNVIIPQENISEDEIELEFKLEEYQQNVKCDLKGTYSSNNSEIYIKAGRDEIEIADYLNEYPLTFRTTDDKMITKDEISVGNPGAISFSKDNIEAINWELYDTDIRSEVETEEVGSNSIQESLKEILLENAVFDFIIFDHSTGEIADFIAVEVTEDKFKMSLFHVKSMGASNYNSSTGDIYEVTGQAVKSVIWLKTKSSLLEKMEKRRKSSHCQFIKGDYDDFHEQFKKSDKALRAKIVIVQPSISKNQDMPFKIQDILAASEYYIKRCGKVNDFKIWGSE
ncbi:MAG: DEAD/DEAH box helicase [Bacillota bacterium]